MSDLWSIHNGRELDATPLDDAAAPPTRVVACLNFWNDVSALRQTIHTWIDAVDLVLAVDGSYDVIGDRLSTDGSREFLAGFPKVCLIDVPGLTQCAKRTSYFERCSDGDYCFVVDADETIVNGSALRRLPRLDVGWIRATSSRYERTFGVPRLIRWVDGLSYRGRHHWIYRHDRLLCTHQYGGPGFEHRLIDLSLHNQHNLGRADRLERPAITNARVRQVELERSSQATSASRMSDSKIGIRECLRILSCAHRDDGIAPSRLHSAINRTTPHSSIFFKRFGGPFGVAEQYRHDKHLTMLALAEKSADIVHFHGVMDPSSRIAKTSRLVFHHHGTQHRNHAASNNAAAIAAGALVLVSNLELLSWTDGVDAKFLPNTVPVARYRALRNREHSPWTGDRPFRIAHSPSQPAKKGTADFIAVCKRLADRGLSVEPVVIHDVNHADALRIKARCDAAFDSFWLGMQCSGIEAAAMGLPVVAGDSLVAARHRELYGYVPYTFAENADELELVLGRLIEDAAYRADETLRVSTHVLAHHDESAVALRYLDLLDEAFGWRTATPTPQRRGSTFVALKRPKARGRFVPMSRRGRDGE